MFESQRALYLMTGMAIRFTPRVISSPRSSCLRLVLRRLWPSMGSGKGRWRSLRLASSQLVFPTLPCRGVTRYSACCFPSPKRSSFGWVLLASGRFSFWAPMRKVGGHFPGQELSLDFYKLKQYCRQYWQGSHWRLNHWPFQIICRLEDAGPVLGSSLVYVGIFKNRQRSHALIVTGPLIRNKFQEPSLSVTQANLGHNLTHAVNKQE